MSMIKPNQSYRRANSSQRRNSQRYGGRKGGIRHGKGGQKSPGKTYLGDIASISVKLASKLVRRLSQKKQQVLPSLHGDLVKDLDDLANQADLTRSAVAEAILYSVTSDEDSVDQLFGEAEEATDDEEEDEGEEVNE